MANVLKQQPIRSVYKDGSIVISNVKSIIDNRTTSYTVVNTWYDGTPMDDSKVDQWGVYSKYKATGEYLRENKPYWGDLFLEVDTVAQLRLLSEYHRFLLQISYYKGVRLGGYYAKGDTPGSIDYFTSETGKDDDGGSVFVVYGINLEHNFEGYLDVRYFGVFPHLNDITTAFTHIANYVSGGYVINVPYGAYKGNISIVDKSVKINFNYSTFTPISDQVGAIRLGGSRGEIYNVTGTVRHGETTINLSGSHDLVIGDIVMLEDKSVRPSDGLANMNKELLKILDVQGAEVLVEDMVRGDFVVGQITLQKINVVNDVIVENLIIQDSDSNTFPCLWVTDVENIVVDNYKCYGFFGNALRIDRCYAGRTNNTYFIKPRSALSGQGTVWQ